LPGLFCGSVIGRSVAMKPSGAARNVRIPAAAGCSVLRPCCIPEGCIAR
jgi:hypothetical protein